jgi:hypothetical protein
VTITQFLNCIGWKLVVADIDGVLWATDSYWMRPYEDSIVQRALNYWNLDGAGVYDVEAALGAPEYDDAPSAAPTVAIRPSSQPPYKADVLRDCVTRETPDPLTLLKSKGEPLLVQVHGSDVCAVFEAEDGSHTWVRRDFLDIAAGGIGWHTGAVSRSEPLPGQEPIYRQIRVGDGFVMPIRQTTTGA